MINLIKLIVKEFKSFFVLLYHQEFYLLLILPFFNLLKKNKKSNNNFIYLYVVNNNLRELDIYNLLKNHFNIRVLYKKKPKYLNKNNQNIFIYPKFFFWHFFFNNCKKIIFVSETSYALPYIISDNQTVLCSYDMVNGYNKGFLREVSEVVTLKFTNLIIDRDLRFKNTFKKQYKNLKSILIIDSVKKIKKIKKEKKIHAVSLGYIDNNLCSIEKTIEFFCKNKIFFHIFSSQKNLFKDCDYLFEQTKKFKEYLIIEKPIYGKKLLNKLTKFHIGVSPHENYRKFKFLNHTKNYYVNTGSQRVMSYLSCNLVNLFSKKFKFHNELIKTYGGKAIYYEDLFYYDNFLNNIKKHLQRKEGIQGKNKKFNQFFNNDHKAKKLVNFLKHKYE